eukprot:scaffold326187_cov29-Attheya_sp.AAC.2
MRAVGSIFVKSVPEENGGEARGRSDKNQQRKRVITFEGGVRCDRRTVHCTVVSSVQCPEVLRPPSPNSKREQRVGVWGAVLHRTGISKETNTSNHRARTGSIHDSKRRSRDSDVWGV